MTTNEKYVTAAQIAWKELNGALNALTLQPGPINFEKAKDAATTYAATMYELGCFNARTRIDTTTAAEVD